jgi:hypothetical protein
MSAGGQDADRQRLLDALREVWRDFVTARHLDLFFFPDQVRPVTGGWAVPLASGSNPASAYELLRTVSTLQEEVEKRTRFDVNLYVDPRLAPPAAGTRN